MNIRSMNEIGDGPGCREDCNVAMNGCAMFRPKMDVWIVVDKPGATHCYHPRGSILVVKELDELELQ